MTEQQIETKRLKRLVRLSTVSGVALETLRTVNARLWALRDSIAAEVAEKVSATQNAWRKLGNGITPYLENSPELYGRKGEDIAWVQPEGFTLHRYSTPADCELSETDSAFVSRATHGGIATPDDIATPDEVSAFNPPELSPEQSEVLAL